MTVVHVRTAEGTRLAERVEPAWLRPDSGATVWVDIANPTPDDGRLLSETFHFHPLSVEDALSTLQFPKAESYPGYLYVILHGIDISAGKKGEFATRDIDFFLGPNYLVTVHDGESRSIARIRDACAHHERILAEGPVALMH